MYGAQLTTQQTTSHKLVTLMSKILMGKSPFLNSILFAYILHVHL